MKAEIQKDSQQRRYLGPILIGFAVFLAINYFSTARHGETIPYSEFLQLIDEGNLSTVTISDPLITGELKNVPAGQSKNFGTVGTRDEKLVERLHSKGIPFKNEVPSPAWSWFFSWILPFLLLYGLWNFIFGRMERSAQGGLFSMTKSRAKIHMEKEVKTTFADVAGIDEAKEELREAVEFLKNPTKFTRLGGRLPKGILLLGPPGTGKTLLARAAAGEAQVPFFSINGSEFVELFVGVGAARVRDLFDQARKHAPCILFIDEIDALGKSRAFGLVGSGGNDEKEQTLNQLLAEMDGFDSSEGVVLLAATNRPEILDPALLRAGRFDRQIILGNPDQAGRLQILKVHSKKIKLHSDLDLTHVASFTSGFSGADLANLVNEAALVATRRGADSVTEQDFSAAVERIVAGLEKKSKVMNEAEKRRIAYHEIGHATVALSLNTLDKVHKVSIIPRGMGALGYTMQRPTEDRYVLDEDELLCKISVFLGGRAAEKIHLGKVSTGAADDLAKATDVARAMVAQFGMSERLGLTSLEGKHAPFLQSPYDYSGRAMSEKMSGEVDSEIKIILERSYHRAMGCLERNEKFVAEAAKKLIEKETLEENEISDLWIKYGQSAPQAKGALKNAKQTHFVS
ncbi:MAG: ATP-dependent zinc metalloprotease FtsH [Bdellovibrionales bacterium]